MKHQRGTTLQVSTRFCGVEITLTSRYFLELGEA